MTEVPGMEILRATLAANRDTLVVIMTGNPSVESNLEALRIGAWDYILKPFTPTHLDVLVGRAMHTISKGRNSRIAAAHELSEIGNSDLVNCLGIAPSFRKTVALARRVSLLGSDRHSRAVQFTLSSGKLDLSSETEMTSATHARTSSAFSASG